MKETVKHRMVEKLFELHGKFFTRQYKSLLELLQPQIINLEKLRLGKVGDGTYVLPTGIINNDCYLLSFGVADDISFETDFSELFPQSKIFAFDPSIDSMPATTASIHFESIGVSGQSFPKWKLFTLSDIIKKNNLNKENQVVIKMDIEGWEWGVLQNLDSNKLEIPVIVIEFHIMSVTSLKELVFFPYYFYQRRKIIENLLKSYYIFHLHVNNYKYSFFKNFTFPWLWEVSLVKKSYFYDMISSDVSRLNQINCPEKEDFQYPFIK